MPKRIGYRLCGSAAFVAVFAAAHAQINVSGNPNLYQSEYTENFQGFEPAGAETLTPGPVGLLSGVSVFGGNGAISMTTLGDGTFLYIYAPNTPPAPPGPNPPLGDGWELGYAGLAGTYASLPQGMAAGNYSFANNETADITIGMQPNTSYSYFGGYFQAAYLYNPYNPINLYTGEITFTFYGTYTDPSNVTSPFQETLVEQTNPTETSLTNQLVGMAFTFNSGYTFNSVAISGDFLAMGSLRVNQTVETVPEPAPFAVMGLGLGALALLRRRRTA